MSKTVIVVSTYVDSVIQSQQPDVRFLIFKSLIDLHGYVETTPIRANTMYITAEVLGRSVNTSLTMLLNMLENPFLRVDSIEYITEANSPELIFVKHMLEELQVDKWKTIIGYLTREYITSLITGTLKTDDIVPVRRAVFRQRRSDYVAERMKRRSSLEDNYPTAEEELAEVPSVELIPIPLMDIEDVCSITTVAGIPSQERTVFSFIMSQFLAFEGKTLIIEKDHEFLTLSDIASKSGVVFVRIDIQNLYVNPQEVFRYIKSSSERLFVLTSSRRGYFDYSFICNLMYNNLANTLKHLVVESNLNEVASSTDYITVFPTNIVDILKTIEELPDNYKEGSEFLGVNMRNVQELSVVNTEALTLIIKDLLQLNELKQVNIVNIKSLKLGGEAHDLRMLIKSR